VVLLSACDQCTKKSSDGESDAAVKDLREILALRWQRKVKRSKLCSSDFGNNAVTWLKVGFETLPEMMLLEGTCERLG
jgi:hypothetical protein